jgi:clan AA aspartic protease (TIGR02281 family)
MMMRGCCEIFVLLQLFILAPLALPNTAWADFYKYTDADGVVHFVDDPTKIPRQYLKKIKTYEHSSENGQTTKVRIEGNRVLVPVTLGYNGRQVQTTLILDTGATITAVNSDMVGGLDLDYSKTRSMKARVAGGGIVQGTRVRMDYIAVGPHRVSGVDVAIIKENGPRASHDGLLGMNFLRNYHYRIDFEGQQIIWQ